MNFTASQIAAALGITPQAVRKQLRGIAPIGMVKASGVETASWTVAQLPAQMAARLESEARQQKCRNIEALLSNPRRLWLPVIPLENICDDNIQAAMKLRTALRNALINQHGDSLVFADVETQAVADYERIFGYVITARYWRELFSRTVERDNGFENWDRLEIYLPKNPCPRSVAAESVAASTKEFAEILDYVCACGNPAAPTDIEKRGIWALAFDKYNSLVSQGMSEKLAARRIREFLFNHAPFVATSRDTLLKAFNCKLERLKNSNGDMATLGDARAQNGPCFNLPDSDRDLLIHRAVFHFRGDIAPAWRELLNQKLFSTDTISLYAGNAQNKSHVPASIRESITPEVEIMTKMYQGPRAFDAIKGYVTRSYDGIHSLQCISGDDFTLNTYFYVPDGKGWFKLTRGQVILFIDFRSSRILGWALEPRKSYSSLTIRSLATHIFGEFGVPEILYFERGLWKSATLLKGKNDPFTFTEISQGLREFGTHFIHAIRPRTKTVERIGGMFQDIAEAEPGYCGRNERRDAPESLRKQMAEVEAPGVHPQKYFYSLDQWNKRIGQLVRQYNADSQQGHMLNGMSPEQAFEAHLDHDNPPLQFPAALRYLLAHDKRVERVTLNGVTIQIGKQKFNYRGKEIAHLVGREVLAWFDPENTETVVLTNTDRTNPICVSRSENPSALESIIAPESGTLGREMARIAGQSSYLRTRYNVVKAAFPLPHRHLLASAQALELSQEIAEQKKAVCAEKSRVTRQRSQARRFNEQTGIFTPEAGPAIALDEQRELAEFLQTESAPSPENHPAPAPSLTDQGGEFTYKIKPFKGGKAKQ
jgi:hypothetical protein